MSRTAKEIVEKLHNTLRDNFEDFEGLYLFGSHAKGIADNDSDIDVVVLMNAWNWKETSNFYRVISDFTYKHNTEIDLHPMTRADLERNPFFYNEVVNKGIFYAV